MLWSTDVIELNKQISNLTSQSHTLAQLKQQGIVDSAAATENGGSGEEHYGEALL